MSTDYQRHDIQPPQPGLDEGYWESLLQEGEHAEPIASETPEEIETDYDDGASYNENSHPVASSREDWREIELLAQADRLIELQVTGFNRGGLLVEWRTLRGFVPASQLLNFPVTANANLRRKALQDRVGQALTLRIIELVAEQNRLILSERAAQAQPGERDAILRQLAPGDLVEGLVTNLCDFGAFVDLGGLEGLIHISELSWGRVGHPSQVLRRGEQVQAYVLGVNPGEGRIALSIKRLRPDPWKTVEDRYETGQIVEGVITNVVDFGAFACIEDGLEGLIHVSELAEGQFLHPRNVVAEGQTVQARILSINGAKRRLGLSLRLGADE